jgi:hypothetical protein
VCVKQCVVYNFYLMEHESDAVRYGVKALVRLSHVMEFLLVVQMASSTFDARKIIA